MSGSVTVIGGHNGSTLTGLVTVPVAFANVGDTVSGLQGAMSSLSFSVLGGTEGLNNTSVFGGPVTVPSILEITNTDSTGATIAGTTSVDGTVAAGYNALVVQAPGADTISGNGSTNFLAVFGSNSSVNFNTEGGSGSIYASGNDNIVLSGSVWSVVGGSLGGVFVNTATTSTFATLTGAGQHSGTDTTPSNAIGSYAQNLSVLSQGTSDLIVTGGAGILPTADTVTVTGFANVIDIGASDTVVATGNGSFSGHFGAQGGKIDFINNSSAASSIIGTLDSVTGLINSSGSVTVDAGAGGGVYDGGTNGGNSLVGGSGAVTLFSAGVDNYLSASGKATGSYNLLNAASGSNDTLVGAAGSGNNVFFAGTGTESIVSNGSGAQTYFAGTLGSETISGSTVSGATNSYIFNQSSADGGGTYTLLHFKPGSGYINPNDSISGVKIDNFTSLSGASFGTQINLSDGSTIKLIGVASSSFNASIDGGTKF